ncbi:MAG: hypothetical protein SFV53_05575 [Rickettsiales bacterium]|nr:hypothetical protein [Rickettsiales bacterium]
MKISLKKISVIFIIFFFWRFEACAQVVDSKFYRWTVYELQEDELQDKQCYIVANPIKSESDQPTRAKPYIMITRFQRQRSEEVSIYGGFEYKLNSKIFVAIDDDAQYRFPTKKNIAWAKNKYDDVEIIQKMLDAKTVRVRSDSAIGTFAIDEYSMQGIARAYLRMREICK